MTPNSTSVLSAHTLRLHGAFLLFILIGCSVWAQQLSSLSPDDMKLLRENEIQHPEIVEKPVQYRPGNKRQRFNPFYHLYASSLYLYQRCISPVLSRNCAFSPSCSAYSQTLVAEYGLVKGIVCSADRLMRCNRIALTAPSNHWLIDPDDGHIHESAQRYRPR